MDKKIDLEEILSKYTTVFYQDSPDTNGAAIDKYDCRCAMLDFGKQILELAAENAKCIYVPHPHKKYDRDICLGVDKQSILDTIKQV